MDLRQLLRTYNPWWDDPHHVPATSQRFRVRREEPFERMRAAAQPNGEPSLVVRGPRRVGKTVLLQQLAADLLGEGRVPPGQLLFADLSDPAFDLIADGPARLDAIVDAMGARDSSGPRILLLDELQGVRDWDRWLKHACDWRDVKIVATGSSSLELARGGSESGRGRWDELVLEGLSFTEWLQLSSPPGATLDDALVSNPAALDEYLEGGGLPEFIGSLARPVEQRRRLRFDLERDLKKELSGLVRNPNDTWRLYQSLAIDSGNTPRAKKLAEAIGIDPQTVKSHLTHLESQLLIARLRPSIQTPSGRVRSLRNRLTDEHIFATEHGHITALSAATAPLENDHLRGRIYETAVFTALRAAARALDALEIGYLREDGGSEVDFTMTYEGRTVGVEVSSTARVDKKVALAKKAKDRYDVDVVVVSSNPTEQWMEGVHCISMRSFLLEPIKALTGEQA